MASADPGHGTPDEAPPLPRPDQSTPSSEEDTPPQLRPTALLVQTVGGRYPRGP